MVALEASLVLVTLASEVRRAPQTVGGCRVSAGGSDACWEWNSDWERELLLHFADEEGEGHRKGCRDGAQGQSQLYWVATVQEKLLFFLTSSGLQDPPPPTISKHGT